MVADYCADSLQRRATSLQKSDLLQDTVQLNTAEIERLDLQVVLVNSGSVRVKQGAVTMDMPLLANNSIPDGCVLLPSGTQSSSELGSAFGSIEITV